MHLDLNFVMALVRLILECARALICAHSSGIFYPVVYRLRHRALAREWKENNVLHFISRVRFGGRFPDCMSSTRGNCSLVTCLIKRRRRSKRTDWGRGKREQRQGFAVLFGNRFCGDARKNVNFIGRLNFHDRN